MIKTHAVALGLLLAAAGLARAQQEIRLQDGVGWTPASQPETDRGVPIDPDIAEARRLLAENRPAEARQKLRVWLDLNSRGESPWIADAYLLLGDSMLAMDEEYNALIEYETLVKEFPGSTAFPIALERQFGVGKRYLAGLRKRILGMRLEDATPIGEELMLRIAERLPGSQLAELAVLELADYYYRTQDLRGAAETYDVFLQKFPESEHRSLAHRRKILANVAQFKGPEYDASGLREARLGVEDFADRFPSEAARSGLGDALVARLDESAAAQKYNTADWYLRQGDPASARLMFSRLTETHPGTVAAQRALDLMLERGWVKPAQPPPAPAQPPAENNP